MAHYAEQSVEDPFEEPEKKKGSVPNGTYLSATP
jgi:hypothetical protein